ncbi:MAG: DUF1015 domain-containing protein [Lachnospiraceae bacterium]|nr:DUF1015 domain-containing protein [Lachnospiraceae bacterium]
MNCLHVPKIMMPKEGTDLYKWSVIACDQYTSQPEYWQETEKTVGNVPSTLRLILPEVYLEGEDEKQRVDKIHDTMKQYMKDGTLQEMPEAFVLVERSYGKEFSRFGLVVEIDLETYEYKKGSHSLIRPTEMTVEERIPPRLRVRQTAALELPHIMLLIDDPGHTVIEPLMAKKDNFKKIYDTDLMQKGGHITGWFIPKGEETEQIIKLIEKLADPDAFKEKYNLKKEYPLLNLAVGDGNHSMATAKAAWENIKQGLSQEEMVDHPARFCLCEVVNVQDESLEIEPIHRVMFDVNKAELLREAKTYYEARDCEFVVEDGVFVEPYADEKVHCFAFFDKNGAGTIKVSQPAWGIAVATLQNFLDEFLSRHKECRIDYIHGRDVVEALGSQSGNMGFLLPEINKEDLFKGVIVDGVLPRKTFSMGEANEKRYYMESKSLVKKS